VAADPVRGRCIANAKHHPRKKERKKKERKKKERKNINVVQKDRKSM